MMKKKLEDFEMNVRRTVVKVWQAQAFQDWPVSGDLPQGTQSDIFSQVRGFLRVRAAHLGVDIIRYSTVKE